jgi:hypothetical protein
MNVTKENAAIVGVGAVACAACCASPIIGFLAAIGLGTATGIACSGLLGVAIATVGAFIVLRRHRRKSNACRTAAAPVAVEMQATRTQR